MPLSPLDCQIRRAQGTALVLLPSRLILVFAMHFHRHADFFRFHLRYMQCPAARTVEALVAMGNRRPVIHDPHMLADLGLPIYLLGAAGLYALGREIRPRLAVLGMAMTAPHGALLITTTLARLAMAGLAAQALALWRLKGLPRWAPVCVAAGCGLVLAFWDLDNWMLIGAVLILMGAVPMARLLRAEPQ